MSINYIECQDFRNKIHFYSQCHSGIAAWQDWLVQIIINIKELLEMDTSVGEKKELEGNFLTDIFIFPNSLTKKQRKYGKEV